MTKQFAFDNIKISIQQSFPMRFLGETMTSVFSNIKVNNSCATIGGGFEFEGVKGIMHKGDFLPGGLPDRIRLTTEDFREVKRGETQYFAILPSNGAERVILLLETSLPGEYVWMQVGDLRIAVEIVGNTLKIASDKLNQLFRIL
jgi:hypothetical protein